MKQYYITEFQYPEQSFYCIWYTNDIDGFVTEKNKIQFFNDLTALKLYCKEQKIYCEDGITNYNITQIKKWFENNDPIIDSSFILDIWNIADDISNTTGEIFIGNSQEANDIYDKLFYGNNLPSFNATNHKYEPNWDKNEYERLREIMINSMKIIDNTFF